ncbi:unnamed protein product [Pedinophyceae sp. YPF-701]|nr:unnamed protein product [Pedinophyceae sp. YPF-701]
MLQYLAAGAMVTCLVFDFIAMGGLAKQTRQCIDNSGGRDACGDIYGINWAITTLIAVYGVLIVLMCLMNKIRGMYSKSFICGSLAMFFYWVVLFADAEIVIGNTEKKQDGAVASGYVALSIGIPAVMALVSLAPEQRSEEYQS